MTTTDECALDFAHKVADGYTPDRTRSAHQIVVKDILLAIEYGQLLLQPQLDAKDAQLSEEIKTRDDNSESFFAMRAKASGLSAKLAESERRCEELRKIAVRSERFAYDLASNYDCDNDAHKHGTPCRTCRAEEFGKELQDALVAPQGTKVLGHASVAAKFNISVPEGQVLISRETLDALRESDFIVNSIARTLVEAEAAKVTDSVMDKLRQYRALMDEKQGESG